MKIGTFRIRRVQRGRGGNGSFLEEWQQVVLLKRALMISPDEGRLELMTPGGEAMFFDACRYAADVLGPEDDPFDREVAQDPNSTLSDP
jgi:hypothetical protein